MITLHSLSASIGDKKILKDINYTFEAGKVYAVMGPNGSGKSTLAYALMGHPSYTIDAKSKILFEGEPIQGMKAEERSEKGLFLSFQSPLSLSGVKVYQMLQLALQGKKDPLAIRNEVKKVAQELQINEELLSRSLNEGASGGEKKKMEVLQAAVLDKKFLIFDEVDTGVDIDSLKTIAKFLDKNRKGKTYVIIAYYNRILRYIKPDKVLIITDGMLKKEGDHTLAEEIEKNGYKTV